MWQLYFPLFSLAYGLFFTLEPLKERCIGLRVPSNHNFTCDYVISGEGEYNVLSRVTAPSGTILYQSPGHSREGHFNAIGREEGQYRMCFRGLDRRPKSISLAFLQRDLNDFEDLEGEVKEFGALATAMRTHLDTVILNIRFTREQELAHYALTEGTNTLVLWTALAKVLVLALVALLQIGLLTHTLGLYAHKSPI